PVLGEEGVGVVPEPGVQRFQLAGGRRVGPQLVGVRPRGQRPARSLGGGRRRADAGGHEERESPRHEGAPFEVERRHTLLQAAPRARAQDRSRSKRNAGPRAGRAGAKSPATLTGRSARSGRRASRWVTALASHGRPTTSCSSRLNRNLWQVASPRARSYARREAPVRRKRSAASAASSALRRARVTPSPVNG